MTSFRCKKERVDVAQRESDRLTALEVRKVALVGRCFGLRDSSKLCDVSHDICFRWMYYGSVIGMMCYMLASVTIPSLKLESAV